MAFPLCRAVAALVRMGLSPSLHQWAKCRQQKAEVRRQQKAGGRVTRCEHPSRAGLGPGGQCWRCLQRGQMAEQPCQTAPGLAPHRPPWAGAGVVGPQA